jgi:hypothetical protein
VEEAGAFLICDYLRRTIQRAAHECFAYNPFRLELLSRYVCRGSAMSPIGEQVARINAYTTARCLGYRHTIYTSLRRNSSVLFADARHDRLTAKESPSHKFLSALLSDLSSYRI